MTSVLAALTPSYAGLFGSLVFDVVVVVLVVVEVAGMWMVFEKAGDPGWGSLIPVYNLYLLCRIAGRPAGGGCSRSSRSPADLSGSSSASSSRSTSRASSTKGAASA
jgi:hypothetical protein